MGMLWLSDAIQEAIETLGELKRMHQLNFELIEQLTITCGWLVDNNIEIPNSEHLRSLIGKSLSLIAEIQADEPKILQYKKLSDDSYHEPRKDDKLTEPKKATA
jgi:hypothetical protein